MKKKYEELLVSGKEKQTDNELIFRDECSSILNEDSFSKINSDIKEIIASSDIIKFKELSKEYADYGIEEEPL